LVQRTVTAVVCVISGLAFTTSFGNGWKLAVQLGVPHWIAPLITPAVDLSVVALIVSIQYIRAQGMTVRLLSARLLLLFCGVTTLVINVGLAVAERRYGRAAFDAIAPLLLIFWGEVGPGLLALLHRDAAGQDELGDELSVVPKLQKGPRTVPVESGPSAELVARARALDTARRNEAGRPISRDRLRAALGVSNALAGELVRVVRSPAPDGEAG
jgi:hypothetical protein